MTQLTRSATAILAACIALATQPAAAQHPGDVHITHDAGQVITGRINDDLTIDAPFRVFPATFGDSGTVGFTADPGFDAPAGTFPTGTFVGFNILTELLIWNGDGFEPTDGETLRISFGPLNVVTGGGFVPGFELAVQSNGGWHRHYGYTLLSPAGQPASQDPVAPGIFLLELELYSTAASIPTPSESFWKVFNHDMPDDEHDLAVQWVLDNLIGDPGSPCPADLTGDGAVDGADLAVLLGAWGACDGNCPADLTGDDAVDGADLAVLLGAWGSCP